MGKKRTEPNAQHHHGTVYGKHPAIVLYAVLKALELLEEKGVARQKNHQKDHVPKEGELPLNPQRGHRRRQQAVGELREGACQVLHRAADGAAEDGGPKRYPA